MRRFIYSDLVAAARVLFVLPDDEHEGVLGELFRAASISEEHWVKCGSPDPKYGDGTLQSATSSRRKAAEFTLNDKRFRECLIKVLAFSDRGSS